MSAPTLTPDAKKVLAGTIRALHDRLLEDFRAAADSAYLLGVPAASARLPEAARIRRKRLEDWLAEQVRTAPEADRKKKPAELRDRFLRQAVKEAASTLLHRLVLLRMMEALSAGRPRAERLVAHDVVTRGWQSPAYREFREFAPALCDDVTEGYAALLEMVFEELALDLPGLYGDVGLTRLFPVPPATLRELVEALNDPALDSAWTDDTTLGWVYQYWNDPEREALDEKIKNGGKIEPHEIASKTQMFTERYMVEWLLHNSLGLMWLAMCRKHGWTADAEAVLPALEARRVAWRAKREAGEVALDALMPIEAGLEDAWKYYVPQPIPDDAVEKAPASVRALKILDPACGSGHFLVIAFDLLAALHEEEMRHRGEVWTRKEIAESILENNLHGVDIDPRAVQIAAAAVFLKARVYAPDSKPRRVNLVAPALRLGQLPDDDPALVRLRREIRDETGIPEALTRRLVTALSGVDHLGTLLKVDTVVEEAIKAYESEYEGKGQGDLFGGFPAQQVKLGFEKKKATVLEKLEQFLSRHAGAEDLGLRLDGEQIAAGVRFVRMVKDGYYDLVIGNPPYQGTNRMADTDYVKAKYPHGRTDLYAAFLERGLALARPGGLSALLTMRGWMFLGQFQELREHLLKSYDLRTVGDLGTGAFSSRSMDDVISAGMTVWRCASAASAASVALQAAPLVDKTRDAGKPDRRCAALWCQNGRFEFDTRGFVAIDGEPIVYWWREDFLRRYSSAPKLGEAAPVRQGAATSDNIRFLRRPWEVGTVAARRGVAMAAPEAIDRLDRARWHPYVKGAAGRVWFEPLADAVNWGSGGLEVRSYAQHLYGSYTRSIKNERFYFQVGIAFTPIGSDFCARVHRYASVFDVMGQSVFPTRRVAETLCLMNSATTRFVLESINPSVHFQVGDVNRLPIFPIESAAEIYEVLDRGFTEHEAARETSFEFIAPGRSPWRYAQDWAQRAVDRSAGAPLPPYESTYDPPEPAAFVSHAFGVAIGRFFLKISSHAPIPPLPHGILYLSAASQRDSLPTPACAPLRAAWEEHGGAVGGGDDLRTYLRKSFFAYHREIYENRPIYFPLSSAKKSFVAWVSIHRWADNTLHVLLAEHLLPEQRALEGELDDLRRARAEGDGAGKARAERRFSEVQKLSSELGAFIQDVTECAERGPRSDDKTTRRMADARFVMNLDDGVMVNSAALWPLLEPQWKDPKKWWKELASVAGKKDYDWSHLAARYFPARVDEKCQKDPSLAVAHGCFWRYHPQKAYAWELRLQDEIGEDFLIDELDAAEHRARFLAKNATEAREIMLKEVQRRERKKRKDEGESQVGMAYDQEQDEGEEDPS
jgi:hypothetical protein